MRLITWNCQGAFRNKMKVILSYKPDILIVQECEQSEKLFLPRSKKPKDVLWFGDNPHKGLGIFSFSDFQFRLLENYDPSIKYISPIEVKNENFNFSLFAIWANNKEDIKNQYVGQLWKAIDCYQDLLQPDPVILAGDFNSNTIWDRPKRVGNHSDVVTKLKDMGIQSIYHAFFKQTQGKEEHPTFYLHRDKRKPYHLDYCFASTILLKSVKDMKVGTFRKWIKHSDHAPLIVDFDFK